jgi:hypothetical protein
MAEGDAPPLATIVGLIDDLYRFEREIISSSGRSGLEENEDRMYVLQIDWSGNADKFIERIIDMKLAPARFRRDAFVSDARFPCESII